MQRAACSHAPEILASVPMSSTWNTSTARRSGTRRAASAGAAGGARDPCAEGNDERAAQRRTRQRALRLHGGLNNGQLRATAPAWAQASRHCAAAANASRNHRRRNERMRAQRGAAAAAHERTCCAFRCSVRSSNSPGRSSHATLRGVGVKLRALGCAHGCRRRRRPRVSRAGSGATRGAGGGGAAAARRRGHVPTLACRQGWCRVFASARKRRA